LPYHTPKYDLNTIYSTNTNKENIMMLPIIMNIPHQLVNKSPIPVIPSKNHSNISRHPLPLQDGLSFLIAGKQQSTV